MYLRVPRGERGEIIGCTVIPQIPVLVEMGIAACDLCATSGSRKHVAEGILRWYSSLELWLVCLSGVAPCLNRWNEQGRCHCLAKGIMDELAAPQTHLGNGVRESESHRP